MPRDRASALLELSADGRLRIGGELEGDALVLAYSDLGAFPGASQVRDVAAFAAGSEGEGVRLEAIAARARPKPGTLYATAFVLREGRVRSLSYFRSEVEPLAIVLYARGGAALAPDAGGPFRLVVPGHSDPRARDVPCLCAIDFARRPAPGWEPARNPLYRRAHVAPDPGRARSRVVPPP